MPTSHYLQYAVMFLAAAVVAVTLSKRAGLGAVLGYLAAGALIGPHLLKLTPDMSKTTVFSELGVILLLFVIGLELSPQRAVGDAARGVWRGRAAGRDIGAAVGRRRHIGVRRCLENRIGHRPWSGSVVYRDRTADPGRTQGVG